jgi:hypothetical protein
MPKRTPKGVLARSTPDWYSSRCQGFHINNTANGAFNDYVGVYNGNPSEAFHVYYVDIITAGAVSYIFFETIFGNPGVTFNEPTPVTNAPIDPRIGDMGLVPWTLHVNQCIGVHCGGMFSSPQTGNPSGRLVSPYPLIIAPPGYSAMLQVANSAVQIEATIFGCMVKGG